MKKPLVSIIITTKNEERVIEQLLNSIKKQTYSHIETILVDNNSTDKTPQIAKKYVDKWYTKGPERSSQRNYGASKAAGKYVVFLDADMIVTPSVIEECVEKMTDSSLGGLIIPEISVGKGFWAKVKAYEREFYVGDKTIEAARFYDKAIFDMSGKFDEHITGPEDWDLSNRIEKNHKIGRISAKIIHNEENLSFFALLKKKYYYGKQTSLYLKKNNISSISPKTIFFLRKTFYTKPKKIIAHPIMFFSMVLLLTAELIAGGLGYYHGK